MFIISQTCQLFEMRQRDQVQSEVPVVPSVQGVESTEEEGEGMSPSQLVMTSSPSVVQG